MAEDEGELPCVDHVPLKEGTMVKSYLIPSIFKPNCLKLVIYIFLILFIQQKKQIYFVEF